MVKEKVLVTDRDNVVMKNALFNDMGILPDEQSTLRI